MAKPKLALIPATQGSKLYSVLPADGVGDFTFSRNSAATRINKDGLIETVAVGKSRLNYPLIDGVVNGCPSHLLEPSRLQKIQYSEDFSQYSDSSGADIFSNTQISPDGTLNASSIGFSGSEFSRIFISTSTSSSTYTFTLYAKSNASKKFRFRISDSSGTQYSEDFTTTSEWQRFSYEFTGDPNTCAICNSSDASVGSIDVYGFQLEQGSFPTSYIPNYGTSAGITRVAETANGAGDASTFNDSEGVLMAEISAFDESLLAISLSNGTTSNGVVLFYYLNRIYLEINNSLTNVSIFKGGIGSSNSNKIALKYKSGNISMFFNGYEILTSTNAISLSGLDRINFDYGNGNYDFNGNTKQIQYFDSALNDSDLEKLTSWTSFTDLANGQLYSIK